MSISLEVIFNALEALALIAFYYGVLKNKLDTSVRSLDRINAKVDRILEDQVNSKIREGQQPIVIDNIKEKLEVLTDRVDMHDEAIKNIEINLAIKHSKGRTV